MPLAAATTRSRVILAIHNGRELILPVAAVSLIFVMLIPLPSGLMDILLAANLAFAAVVVSLLTLASFLKVQRYAFFEAAKAGLQKVQEVPLLMRVAMLMLAALCILTSLVVLGGWQSPLIIESAVSALRQGLFGA